MTLLRKMETRGWLKHVKQKQCTFFVPCVTQQQLAAASVLKMLQPSSLGSVKELLVCHSDNSVSPAELQTLEEMIQTSRAEVRK